MKTTHIKKQTNKKILHTFKRKPIYTTRKFTICSIEICHNKLNLCYNIFLWHCEKMPLGCHNKCVTKGCCGNFNYATNYITFVANFVCHKYKIATKAYSLYQRWPCHKMLIATKE